MAAIGIVLGVIGAVASVAGTLVQANAAQQANAASQRAEDLRKQQMNLESQRQQIAAVRAGITARSNARAAATNQGAQYGSGLRGGEASIEAQVGYNTEGISQSNQIGNGIFAANKDQSNAETLASFGQGMTSFGHIISGIQLPS